MINKNYHCFIGVAWFSKRFETTKNKNKPIEQYINVFFFRFHTKLKIAWNRIVSYLRLNLRLYEYNIKKKPMASILLLTLSCRFVL